jgi:hypothetical protein
MNIEFRDSNVLILCCQGRSGSTLLLRILNEIEGYHIVGESKGSQLDLVRFYNHIKYTEWVKKNAEVEHFKLSWQNSFDYNKVLKTIYELFEELIAKKGNKTCGFKEIRIGFGTYEELEEDLNGFKELFPKLKIVFLTREIEDLVISEWWAKNKERSRVVLTNQEDYFKRYYSSKSISTNAADWMYFLTYKDICDKTVTLTGLFDFLGEEFLEEKYKNVMSKITR